MLTDVVALYVDRNGAYPGTLAEWYDEQLHLARWSQRP